MLRVIMTQGLLPGYLCWKEIFSPRVFMPSLLRRTNLQQRFPWSGWRQPCFR